MDVRCPGAASLSADEMRLLASVAAVQHEAADEPMPLRALVAPAVIAIAEEIAARVARALSESCTLLPRRRWPALEREHLASTPASSTLH